MERLIDSGTLIETSPNRYDIEAVNKMSISDYKREMFAWILGNIVRRTGNLQMAMISTTNKSSCIGLDFEAWYGADPQVADYAEAYFRGSRPHRMPIDPLETWARLAGVPEVFIWAVWWTIANYGTKSHMAIFEKGEEFAKRTFEEAQKEAADVLGVELQIA